MTRFHLSIVKGFFQETNNGAKLGRFFHRRLNIAGPRNRHEMITTSGR